MSEERSPQEATPQSGTELFYMVGDKKEDADIHEQMLAAGTANLESSLDLARQLGLTEEQIGLLYGEEQPSSEKTS